MKENKTCSKPPTSATYLNFQTFDCWIPPSWLNLNLWWILVKVIGPPHPNIMALITMVPWNLWPAPLNLVTFVDVKNRQTPRSILRTPHNTCIYICIYIHILNNYIHMDKKEIDTCKYLYIYAHIIHIWFSMVLSSLWHQRHRSQELRVHIPSGSLKEFHLMLHTSYESTYEPLKIHWDWLVMK